MEAFRMAFGVALVVTIIETCILLYKLIRSTMRKNQIPGYVAQ